MTNHTTGRVEPKATYENCFTSIHKLVTEINFVKSVLKQYYKYVRVKAFVDVDTDTDTDAYVVVRVSTTHWSRELVVPLNDQYDEASLSVYVLDFLGDLAKEEWVPNPKEVLFWHGMSYEEKENVCDELDKNKN